MKKVFVFLMFLYITTFSFLHCTQLPALPYELNAFILDSDQFYERDDESKVEQFDSDWSGADVTIDVEDINKMDDFLSTTLFSSEGIGSVNKNYFNHKRAPTK